jgi:membrane fusion protein, multidrug efflux system
MRRGGRILEGVDAMRLCLLAVLLTVYAGLGLTQAVAQTPGGPPSVGVVRVLKQPITETSEFVGRIQATDRVNLIARVTAFLEERHFTEGTEVKQGDLLYVLEQPPFQADLEAKQAAVQQTQAQLTNASITLNRATSLLHTPAGQQSTVDDARATALSDAAQVLAAQAQQKQSEINLGYTEIHAPISGKIGRTAVTIGNVVSPSTGTLATIVSQDPMYVVFPIAVRAMLELRHHYADKGGFRAVVIRIRLPDGTLYAQKGTLDFEDNTVAPTTDTVILRGSIANPPLHDGSPAGGAPAGGGAAGGAAGGGSARGGVAVGFTERELVDGEFVTVLLEGVEPVELLSIPRAAVLSDQQGDYVYTVDAGNKVQQARVQLGQSSPVTVSVLSGLTEGQMIVLDGIQRVRPGLVVTPGPASPPLTDTKQ